MESNSAIIDFVTGVMPDKLADTNVVLCCVEAAEAGLVAEGRGQPALAGAGRAGDEDGESLADVVAGGE